MEAGILTIERRLLGSPWASMAPILAFLSEAWPS